MPFTISRRGLLTLLLSQAGCIFTRNGPQPALRRAAKYLWSRQAGDGGWHSHTYGLLRSGQSLTPFVLDALLRIPENVYAPPAAKVDRAIGFLRKQARSDGALGVADPDIADYPNYATAFGLNALCRVRRRDCEEQTQRMISYLREQQFTEQNGWRLEDPAYGAWGMGGDRRTPPGTGHVDLSMTRYVIEALRSAGVPASDPAFARARRFIERCQNFGQAATGDGDGGFFFTATEFDTNKAGHDGRSFRSYGTTTADGILALLGTGCSPGHPRVAAAQRWLAAPHDTHQALEVPGFVGKPYQRWPRGLAFYYASASAEVFRKLNLSGHQGVIDGLVRSQRADGSWSNPENLVKEDDPLIATPFAVRALTALEL